MSLIASLSNENAGSRVLGNVSRVVGIFAASETAVHPLLEQGRQLVLYVALAPALLQAGSFAMMPMLAAGTATLPPDYNAPK